MYLTNIEKTHPGAKDLLSKGGIAVARSMIPGALSAVDKTMEETFMRFAKSSGKCYIMKVSTCSSEDKIQKLYLHSHSNTNTFVFSLFSRWFRWTIQSVWGIPEMVSNNVCPGQIL